MVIQTLEIAVPLWLLRSFCGVEISVRWWIELIAQKFEIAKRHKRISALDDPLRR